MIITAFLLSGKFIFFYILKSLYKKINVNKDKKYQIQDENAIQNGKILPEREDERLMIATPHLELKSDKEEILPGYSEEFPYVCMFRRMDECIGRKIAWHWHSALEIDYVEEGEIEYRMPDCSVILHKGEAVFINSDVLHTVSAKTRGGRLYAHLFDRSLVGGAFGSIYMKKYVEPVLENLGPGVHVIRPDDIKRIRVIENMFRLADVYEKREEGYEFTVRSVLSELWYFLYRDIASAVPLRETGNRMDSARILTMMRYVQEHYNEKISIEMIAESANISTRECGRCFRNKIGMSPGNYLNDYRVRSAAELLLSTDDSIMEIAEKCGFSSGGYFAKSFFKMIGCTPREYRRSEREKKG